VGVQHAQRCTLALLFSRDHKVTIRDVAFDAFGHGSRAAMFGTWQLDGTDVVYTLDRDQDGPMNTTTTRFPLSELKHAVPVGTDPNARWERL
jgi:hypothetical protein